MKFLITSLYTTSIRKNPYPGVVARHRRPPNADRMTDGAPERKLNIDHQDQNSTTMAVH